MVSTHLKHISQNGSFPQVGVKIKHIWNHHLEKPSKRSVVFLVKILRLAVDATRTNLGSIISSKTISRKGQTAHRTALLEVWFLMGPKSILTSNGWWILMCSSIESPGSLLRRHILRVVYDWCQTNHCTPPKTNVSPENQWLVQMYSLLK